MLTRYVRIGHSLADTASERRLKSVFAVLTIGLALIAITFWLEDRTQLEHAIDTWLVATCLLTLSVMQFTKRYDSAYVAMLIMGIPGEILLLLLNGNRDGDLNFLALFVICAIPLLGPSRSVFVFVVSVVAVVIVVIVEPVLPRISTVIHLSEVNSGGLLFHAPSKQNISTLEAASFCVAVTLIYFVTYSAYRSLDQAKQRIEDLLLNILPPSIAERLSDKDIDALEREGATIADNFEEATILFADIVGFTELATTTSAAALVTLLDRVFAEFDKLSEIHGVEKIKTIGDAYMAVSGLPEPDPNHARNVADMALEMIDTVRRLREQSGFPLRIRIGVNTGPVIAGVIGRKKFIYDLWGDAVNTASRMESHGKPDTIQVSASTYEALKHDYEFDSLGQIEIKGKGEMPVWRLKGRRA